MYLSWSRFVLLAGGFGCCFSDPPSVLFPPSSVPLFLSLSCPFHALLHLYVIPLLLYVYKVFVSLLVSVRLWYHPVFPTRVISSVSKSLPVVSLFFFMGFIDLWFASVCTLFKLFVFITLSFVLVTRFFVSFSSPLVLELSAAWMFSAFGSSRPLVNLTPSTCLLDPIPTKLLNEVFKKTTVDPEVLAKNRPIYNLPLFTKIIENSLPTSETHCMSLPGIGL